MEISEKAYPNGWKLFRSGWILYCPSCKNYIKQSDPQNFSGRKSVIIDDEPCEACKKKQQEREEEIKEAQQIMGRLGTKEESNET
jgi:hypothetical protein